MKTIKSFLQAWRTGKIREVIRFRLFRDILSLYSAHIINVLFGLGATIFIVRHLNPSEYGEFGFFYTTQMIATVLAEIGVFVAMGRLLAISSRDQQKKELLGAGLIITIFIGTAYALVNLLFGMMVDHIFQVKAGYLFRRWWWVSGFIVFYVYLNNAFEGLAEIRKLSLYVVLTKITYVLFLILPFFWSGGLTVDQLIVAYFVPYLLIGMFFIYHLRPSFDNVKAGLDRIRADAREYGFFIYLSNAIGFFALKLDQYFVALFFGPTELGYYHLASNIANPITLFAKSASTSAYRKIANQQKMPAYFLQGMLVFTFFSAIVLIFILPYVLVPVFTSKFLPLLSFFPLVVAQNALYALRLPFGFYFKAMARGNTLLIDSCILIAAILATQFIIRDRLGIGGPALAMVISNMIILFIMGWQYHHYLKKVNRDKYEN